MLWFLVISLALVASVALCLWSSIKDWDGLAAFSFLAGCASITTLIIMTVTVSLVPNDTKRWLVDYNQHLVYIADIKGKKISTSERESEVKDIFIINQDILNAKNFENDPWIGVFTMKIGDTVPLSYSGIPEAVLVNSVRLSGSVKNTLTVQEQQ